METENQYQVYKSKFAEFLKQQGLKKTPERFAILDAIYATEGHFTPESLLEDILNKQNFLHRKLTEQN